MTKSSLSIDNRVHSLIPAGWRMPIPVRMKGDIIHVHVGDGRLTL